MAADCIRHAKSPSYLLILAYLATLFLIWVVLMNRLARRHFKNTTSTPAQD